MVHQACWPPSAPPSPGCATSSPTAAMRQILTSITPPNSLKLTDDGQASLMSVACTYAPTLAKASALALPIPCSRRGNQDGSVFKVCHSPRDVLTNRIPKSVAVLIQGSLEEATMIRGFVERQRSGLVLSAFAISRGAGSGRRPKNHRLVLDGIFWIARTGVAWRDSA